MITKNGQMSLFDEWLNKRSQTTSLDKREHEVVKGTLDELFTLTSQYKTSKSYKNLMQFIANFRFYSPFNALLVHLQMPGATYVAPPNRWLRDYRRRIKPGARPLVILQPMGPVMFVFDISDTLPLKGAPPLPIEVEKPFEVRKGNIRQELEFVIENVKRDGVLIFESPGGSQSAGKIICNKTPYLDYLPYQSGYDKNRNPIYVKIPVRYIININSKLSPEAKYATIVHELAHLYCGHLGTPNNKWWPDRRGLTGPIQEFEAESVAYLVCKRIGLDIPSEQYLADYIDRNENVPAISLERVMKAAGLIETMSRKKMKPRKKQ